MDDDRRLIEETFPIKEVAEAVKKDGKEVIRNLHKWWARRPTGITRAVCYATLIPFSKNSFALITAQHLSLECILE